MCIVFSIIYMCSGFRGMSGMHISYTSLPQYRLDAENSQTYRYYSARNIDNRIFYCIGVIYVYGIYYIRCIIAVKVAITFNSIFSFILINERNV